MLSATSYQLLYISIIVIGTITCVSKYSGYSVSRVADANKPSTSNASLFLTIFLIFFIGLRPLDFVFVDMMSYGVWYRSMLGCLFLFNPEAENLIFDNMFNFMASASIDSSIFFLCIAAVYFGAMYIALKRLFPNDTTYALFVYLGAFSTFSYGTNGIKAGAAASIFLFAFAFCNRKTLVALFCALSLGFHHSMFFPIATFVICYFYKNSKAYFYFWLMCLVLAALHVTYFQFLFAGISEEASGYLSGTDVAAVGMKTGFRIDFILYGALPIAVGYWCIFKKHIRDFKYQLILNYYLFTNGVWMLTMYAPFNNRIAYFSWYMLPIVAIYPFMKLKVDRDQYKQANLITIIYLVFSIYAYNFL